jgi:hypothetical protein
MRALYRVREKKIPRRRWSWLALLLVLGPTAFATCKTNDSHPPLAPMGNLCDMPGCNISEPVAAFAVERASGADAAGCDTWRLSLPQGTDAFASILNCGGNQIRCGAADYRVAATDPNNALTCTVAFSTKFEVKAHVAWKGGVVFDIDGEVGGGGGTVTLSASASLEGSFVSFGPAPCRITSIPFILPGTIWATFDCSADSDAGACAVRGTFVFEGCNTETTIPP